MQPQRTIIIGDVHGCHTELQMLLEQLNVRPVHDRLIFVGDLINKGPDTRAVYKTYRTLGAVAILGNHEYALLQRWEQRWPRSKSYHRLEEEFGSEFEEFVQEVSTWPLYIDTPDYTIVHAGLIPDKHLRDSDPRILVSIRTWDGEGKDLRDPRNPPWFDLYEGDKLVVFGHWAALGGMSRDRVIGLDTGCVYGKALTALVLPERTLVSVPAQKAYCPIRN